MVHPLIGVHAAIGELGVLAFIWIIVELFNPSKKSLKRMKIAAIIGMVSFVTTWISGGWYYLEYYGPMVKPLIKAGPMPWAHTIVMEVKEHVFLFLPFLSFYALYLVFSLQNKLLTHKPSRVSLQWLCALCVAVGMSMAFLGYIISMGARVALEAGVVL